MMRLRNGLCAVLLATLGTAAFALATFRSGHNEAPAARDLQQDSSQPLTRFAVEVPLLDCDGTPCVEASIGNGRQGKWGIDTGNVDSVVDAKVADEAGLKPSQPPRPGTPSGMFRTTIPVLHIGALTLESIGALRMDLSEMISQKQMPHVTGTLAYPVFKDRIVQLDFAHHKLRISDVMTTRRACGNACANISLITFGKEGPPIVVAEGFEINGQLVSAQVDTMYTGSMLIYTASVERLSLSEAAKSKEMRLFPLTDGGVNMRVADAQKEGFRGTTLVKDAAKVYFPTESVHEPDGLFDATVGLELFRDAIVTLDFHDMTITVG
jgi:hypothetical protein